MTAAEGLVRTAAAAGVAVCFDSPGRVPAVRVEDAGNLTLELERALAAPGPRLIEMAIV